MAIRCGCISTYVTVVVGVIFLYIVSLAAGIDKSTELQGPVFYHFTPVTYAVTKMMITLVGIFSVFMTIGAVVESPTLMFPWLAVILTGILTTSILLTAFTLDKSVMIDAGFISTSDIPCFIEKTTGIILITSLLWAVVFHRYKRLISPKKTAPPAEKPLDKSAKIYYIDT